MNVGLNIKIHLLSKRNLCPILGQFIVKVGHQTRHYTLCLIWVLLCEMKIVVAIAIRALLLCIVELAKVLCKPLCLQVWNQSNLLAHAVRCKGIILKKMGMSSQQLLDLLLVWQLVILYLEPITTHGDQFMMMKALQAFLLLLTICNWHNLQEIKYDFTTPQSNAQECQRKMGCQLQRSACHSPFLRIWLAILVLWCAHSSPQLILNMVRTVKVP